MRRDGLLLPTNHFNDLLAAVSRSSELDVRPGEEVNRAMQLMRERIEVYKRERSDPIDVSSFNVLLDIGMQHRRSDAISVTLEWMESLGCKKDLNTYNKLIERYTARNNNSLQQQSNNKKQIDTATPPPTFLVDQSLLPALQMYHQLLDNDLPPNLDTFHTLISAAGDDGDHWLLWCVLNDMELAQARPTERTFQLALKAAEAGKGGRGQWVLPVFTMLSKNYIQPTTSASSESSNESTSATTISDELDRPRSSTLSSATTAVPSNLDHRTSTAAPIPPTTTTLPSTFPRLSKPTYDHYIAAIAHADPPLPLNLILNFLDGMAAAGGSGSGGGASAVTRQNMKELMVVRAERSDQESVLTLMGVMVREGMGVDADVIHHLVRVISKRADAVGGREEERGRAELEQYVEAIDARCIQTQQRAEHRIQSLVSLFEGLCTPRLPAATGIAVRVLHLLQNREGGKVMFRQMLTLFQTLPKQSRSYVKNVTQLFTLLPSFNLTPMIATLTDIAHQAHTADDSTLLFDTADAMQLKCDDAFYIALINRQIVLQTTVIQTDSSPLGPIVERMIREGVKLPVKDFGEMIRAARFKRGVHEMRDLWRYLRAMDIPVAAKWLADMARLCKRAPDVSLAQELTKYAIERVQSTEEGWADAIEAVFLVQVPQQPRDNLVLQLLLSLKATGNLRVLDTTAVHDAAMAALHSRLDAPTEDDRESIRTLLTATESGQPGADLVSVGVRRLLTRALEEAETRTESKAASDVRAAPLAVNGSAAPWAIAIVSTETIAELLPLCTSSAAPTAIRELSDFYFTVLERYFVLMQRPPVASEMVVLNALFTRMQAMQLYLPKARLFQLTRLCNRVGSVGYVHRALLYMAEVGVELSDERVEVIRALGDKRVQMDAYNALGLAGFRQSMMLWAARAKEPSVKCVQLMVTLFSSCWSKVQHNDVWQLWRTLCDAGQGQLVYERAELGNALISAAQARKAAVDKGVVLSAADIEQVTEAISATFKQANFTDQQHSNQGFAIKASLQGQIENERKWREAHLAAKQQQQPKLQQRQSTEDGQRGRREAEAKRHTAGRMKPKQHMTSKQ